MNDSTDLETLWTDYRAGITGYIAKREYNQDMIEDLVSSVYLRALVAIRNGNGYHENAGAWLFQIARSVLYDHWRDKRRVGFVSWDNLPDMPSKMQSPHAIVEQRLDSVQLYSLAATLPGEQAVVTAWYLCGYELSEIAEGMNKTYAAVKQLRTRANDRLRTVLQEAA